MDSLTTKQGVSNVYSVLFHFIESVFSAVSTDSCVLIRMCPCNTSGYTTCQIFNVTIIAISLGGFHHLPKLP